MHRHFVLGDALISSHPPLGCRPSPPQGERSAFIIVQANFQRHRTSKAVHADVISPLVGEMSGRTEGGETSFG
ncbi:hypothetical protein C5750_06560 [Phyllobacterium myrsinacearum]|uniref:Propionyl-coenzyme A carboxylase alpha polypeptide n=1 Tax=Phyllobacterium myrsinacearum TaxID=28101 RepID=A0A2S9K023_9HYPH|nr:hypothetical protein C5750_06560 [Phyllobacterium myrsinacearum]